MVHKCLNSLPCQEWEQVLLGPSQGESIPTNQSNYRGKKIVQVPKGKSNSITIRSLPSKYSKPKSPSNVENQRVPYRPYWTWLSFWIFKAFHHSFQKMLNRTRESPWELRFPWWSLMQKCGKWKEKRQTAHTKSSLAGSWIGQRMEIFLNGLATVTRPIT